MKKKIAGIICCFVFIIILSIGCMENSQYVAFPQSGVGNLEIIEQSVETRWQEGNSDSTGTLIGLSHPDFFHNLPASAEPTTISYWVECLVHNQYDTYLESVHINLAFVDGYNNVVYTKESLFNEGLKPGENKWFTVTINRYTAEYNQDVDCSLIKDVHIIAYSER